jgi:CCR4-NOT transcription complex subunit 7/8
MINEESHSLLTRAGISFERLREQGISVNEFSDYLVSSGKGVVIIEGLLLNPKVRWVVFHGGYDFAYLLKMVHG